jgi:hypothetical protein
VSAVRCSRWSSAELASPSPDVNVGILANGQNRATCAQWINCVMSGLLDIDQLTSSQLIRLSLKCQNRTTAAFYRSRMMLCVVRRCPSMSILDPPIDLQHGLIIHPGSPPSASPAMAHSISRALLDPRLARRRRFDAMSLTRPRR